MRRAFWFGLFMALAACGGTDDDDDELVRQLTRVRVSPEDFLGRLSCGLEGGMLTYQATLVDVTDGWEHPFVLPSSSVVSCKADINFEFVVPGRRYIAHIAGFDRTDVRSQHPGSPVIVDRDGKSVAPKWSSTCWGDDRTGPLHWGGAGGSVPEGLGVEAYDRTVVHVRGCEPLEVEDTAAVSIGLGQTLFGVQCGDGPAEVFEYHVYTLPDAPIPSPQGGAGPDEATTHSTPLAEARCEDSVVIRSLVPDLRQDFAVLAFERGATTASWETTCTARPLPGVVTPARCDPLSGR